MSEPEPDEEWGLNESETIVAECDRCHEVRPVQPAVDPFVREGIVADDGRREWWCRSCFRERNGDV